MYLYSVPYLIGKVVFTDTVRVALREKGLLHKQYRQVEIHLPLHAKDSRATIYIYADCSYKCQTQHVIFNVMIKLIITQIDTCTHSQCYNSFASYDFLIVFMWQS